MFLFLLFLAITVSESWCMISVPVCAVELTGHQPSPPYESSTSSDSKSKTQSATYSPKTPSSCPGLKVAPSSISTLQGFIQTITNNLNEGREKLLKSICAQLGIDVSALNTHLTKVTQRNNQFWTDRELRFLADNMQCPHIIFIEDKRIDQKNDPCSATIEFDGHIIKIFPAFYELSEEEQNIRLALIKTHVQNNDSLLIDIFAKHAKTKEDREAIFHLQNYIKNQALILTLCRMSENSLHEFQAAYRWYRRLTNNHTQLDSIAQALPQHIAQPISIKEWLQTIKHSGTKRSHSESE